MAYGKKFKVTHTIQRKILIPAESRKSAEDKAKQGDYNSNAVKEREDKFEVEEM